MNILEKYGIRYCQPIDRATINAFVLENMMDFNEVFSGMSHPLEAAQHFRCLSESNFGSVIKNLQSIIQTTEENIQSFEKDIDRIKNELKDHEKTGFFSRLFQGDKFKKATDRLSNQVEHLGKSVQKNNYTKEEAEYALRKLRSTVNYWEIFHEAAMDAYSELVSVNSMHAHLDINSFKKMREYYLAAEGLSDVKFDMKAFLNDGTVNTVFALSDSPMDTNGCTVAQAINKLCNIKTADHLVRKHIFTKLLGSGINVSLLASSSQPQPVIG